MDAALPIDEAGLRRRLAALNLEEKVRLLTGADFWSLYPAPKAGLRKVKLSDGPAGVRGVAWDERATSLLLPSPTALAASWDPAQAERAGRLIGQQARDKGIHILLAPTVNLHRSPLGGRHFECYSEDPLLTTQIALGYIAGVQSAGVAATIKHYAGNESETARMTYDARIDERTLRELYLAPFEAAVREGGVWAIMAAYNRVNGASMTDNQRLLTDVLKREWGFDGLVISDWMATRSTDASANAGLDLAMPGPRGPWGAALVAAVREERVPETLIDDKVLRLLRLAARVGALDDAPEPDPTATPDDARAQIRDLATRTIVLLHNDGLLPLAARELRRVALIGPNAVAFGAQGGGSAHVNPAHIVTPLEGLREALGDGVDLTIHSGVFTNRLLPPLAPDHARDPASGEPGLRVEFYRRDGALLAAERRNAGKFVFMPGSGPGALPEATGAIIVRARFSAAKSGTHLFGVSGVGSFTLRMGAGPETAIDLTLEGGDPIEGMMRPPEHRVAVELADGETIDITLRYTMGEFPFAAFGLGHQPPRPSEDDEIAAAVAAARDADVAIVIVGTSDEIESEGFDRSTLALPGRQDELVERVTAANPRTVVVVNAGAPVIMPWARKVAATLWAWLPGQEGGAAIADVLVGAAEPGGRMPTTLPAAEADCPVWTTTPTEGALDYAEGGLIGYRAYAARDIRPAFPFGHGMSYTSWDYQSAEARADGSGGLRVEVALRNSGGRAGREVIQCYLRPADAADAEPLRLVGFAGVSADAGAPVTASIVVAPRTLSRYDADAGEWRALTGRYQLLIGRSALDPRLTVEVAL